MPGYYRGNARSTTTTKSQVNEFLATYRISVQSAKSTKGPLLAPFTLKKYIPPTTQAEETLSVEKVVPGRIALREGARAGAYESDGGWSADSKKK